MRIAIIFTLSILLIVSCGNLMLKVFTFSETALSNAGGSVISLIAIVMSGISLMKVIKNSPKNQKRNAERRKQIKNLSKNDFISFIEQELCKMFSVTADTIESNLTKDLRIPLPEVAVTLYNLGAIYALPVSDDDVDLVDSIHDIAQLLQTRR